MSFVVMEGLDGSGKSTQLKLLKSYLEKHNIAYQYLHFPRVEEGIFGELVAKFLRGDLGKIGEVNSYLVGLIYAGDRNDAKALLNNWIDQNQVVIVDRYIYSNMAFQGAKIHDAVEKQKLWDWLVHLEFEYFGIPKPDVSIFLDVPFTFTTQSLTNQRQGDDRNYLQGKQDIHEADLNFQETVRQEYLALTKRYNDFKCMPCFDESVNMLPPEKVFENLLQQLKNHNII